VAGHGAALLWEARVHGSGNRRRLSH
jgi:hypothetical protein